MSLNHVKVRRQLANPTEEGADDGSGSQSIVDRPLATPADLKPNAVRDLAGALNILLADMFVILREDQELPLARLRSPFPRQPSVIGQAGRRDFCCDRRHFRSGAQAWGTILRSIGHISRLQRIEDNDADFVKPMDMLAELRADNKQLVARMRETHDL
jgi:starvation-inducible DNA-binding protein